VLEVEKRLVVFVMTAEIKIASLASDKARGHVEATFWSVSRAETKQKGANV